MDYGQKTVLLTYNITLQFYFEKKNHMHSVSGTKNKKFDCNTHNPNIFIISSLNNILVVIEIVHKISLIA